jgi:RNA polymerase sigma-70 factor (ECF subfamily)
LCNYHDAEDIVSQVFFVAYEKRANFDGENLSAWLYKITHTRCLNHLKKRKLIFFADIKNPKEESVNPFEQSEIGEDILIALSRLKATDRALLYKRIIDEFSYEELSKIYHKSPTALRKQYERAKNKLVELLSAEKCNMKGSDCDEYKCKQI